MDSSGNREPLQGRYFRSNPLPRSPPVPLVVVEEVGVEVEGECRVALELRSRPPPVRADRDLQDHQNRRSSD